MNGMLCLKCKGQVVSIDVDERIADKHINANTVHWEFCERWDGMTITAQFTQGEKTYDVLVDEVTKTTTLPNELVAGDVDISAFGEHPVTKVRITTVPVRKKIDKSGFVGDGETPIPPTPDLYSQLIDKVNKTAIPHIGENGNWWFDDEDSGVNATAELEEARDEAIAAIEHAKDNIAPAIECEATGAIITVDDAAAMPVMRLVIDIDPKKNLAAGRDIKGYDAVTVQRTGKNLFSSGEETFTQRKRVIFAAPLPAGTYTIGAHVTSNDTDGSTSTISFLDEELETVASTTLNRSAYSRKTITINREVYSAQMYAGANLAQSGGDAATWSNIMLTAGSTEHGYEPYDGQTLTANLPETVYVGSLDWTSGLLTVESYGLAEFNGSEEIEAQSSTQNANTQIFTCAEVKVDNKAKWSTNYAKTISNLFSASAFTTPSYAKLEANTFYWADASGAWRFGWGVPGATAEEFKAFLQASPLKIIVPTTTGRKEYQLNTQQLDMIKGCNNVWSNCGDTDIKYPADTKIYIDKKFAELAEAMIGG